MLFSTLNDEGPIFTASLRFAPLQLTALGHGASTQSPWVDYFAVDEDFVGDQSTFSEKIIALPVDAMPIVASSALDREALTPHICLLYTSPSPRDGLLSRMPSSA